MHMQSGRKWLDGFTAIPTSGNWVKGDLAWNSNPVASGNLGWICITTGTACNTTWQQNTAYSLNQLVYSGSNVYICTQAGTSSTTAPNSGAGYTFGDGTATWMYVNPLAVFKTFGTIGA